METETKRLYEALFLVDSAEAGADWDGVCENITKVLGRSSAEIVSLRKWDDRPLAYEINKKKRGVYILVYFNAAGESISGIERDVQLSENIMRVLILRADHLSQEDIDKDTPLMLAEKAAEAAKAEAEKVAAEKAEAAAAAEAERAAAASEQESENEEAEAEVAEGGEEESDEAPDATDQKQQD